MTVAAPFGGNAGWTKIIAVSNATANIAWAVAPLLQFGSASSQMKEAAGCPAVDQGKAPRGGQGVGVFSGRRRDLLRSEWFVAEKLPKRFSILARWF